jgi:hypothetical protein
VVKFTAQVKTTLEFLTSDTFGFLLKLLTGLAAAGFGLLGVGTETRDTSGHFTRAGRIALIGILCAGVLAVATSVYEFATEQYKAREDREHSKQLMLSVQAGLYPLRAMNLNTMWALNEETAWGLTEYRSRLTKALAGHSCKLLTKLFKCGQSSDGRDSYIIFSNSPLFPQKGSKLRSTLVSEKLTLSFFKENVEGTRQNPLPSFTRMGEATIHALDIPLKNEAIVYVPSTNRIFYGIAH